MGDYETGCVAVLEYSLPELLLGFDIQRAGEIIEHNEFWFSDEHARRCCALRLPTRKFYAACANHRFEVVIHLFQVMVHDGKFCRFVDFIVGAIETEQNVVSQSVAKQARHLCGVGTSRWDEEVSRRGKYIFVPAYLAGFKRKQSEQGTQECCLARTDATCDHCQSVAFQVDVDIVDTSR